MKSRARFIFLVLSVQVACVIFYDLLRCDNQIHEARRNMSERKASPGTKSTRKLKKDKKENVINGLQKQIVILREQLNKLETSCLHPDKSMPAVTRAKTHEKMKGYPGDGSGYKRINKRKERHSRILKHTKGYNGTKVVAKKPTDIPSDWIKDKSEFHMFTRAQIFSIKSINSPKKHLTHKNVAKSGEYWHLSYAMDETTSILKKHLNLTNSVNLTLKTGLYRYDVNFGAEYEFSVQFEGDKSTYNVRLIRPLSSLILPHPPVKLSLNKLINIILPLQGRLDRFEEFLNNFKRVCISRNENVFLTVVYSGKHGVKKARQMLNVLAKDHGFQKFELVTRNQNFNRGHALHDGVEHWKGEKDVLLFFCDVDIVFHSGFIDRCRTFTEPARTVYYPIVFSLYNPEYVQTTTTQFWKISKDTGYWRYYGFGMTCQHRQDYIKVGGFDLNIQGWGGEDVGLHQKYVTQPNIRIIRAPDSGLFHRYHTKYCNSTLPQKQYQNCLSVKLNVEASKIQYGRKVLTLKEDIEKLKLVKPNS